VVDESVAWHYSSSLTIDDAIPEFVPGKPWPGITQKSVEDDPHITPGSFSRSLSLSVNTVKDDYLGSLTKTSPSESLPWSATNPRGIDCRPALGRGCSCWHVGPGGITS
jgi:hypothetical protein